MACATRCCATRTSFLLSFTRSLMTYALGRRVEAFDMPAVRRIIRDAEAQNYRISAFVNGIVESDAFRMAKLPASQRQMTTDSPQRAAPGVDMFITRQTSFAPHRCSRASAPPWRCRFSTPCCRRGAIAQGRKPLRLIAMEMVHGAAGSTAFGIKKNMWSPAATGSAFDLSPTSLKSLEPYRDYLTIVSNTDVRNAEAFAASEIGADHFRSAAVFLTQSKPKQTQGSDVFAGTSFDQIYAQKFGDATPIPSMQLCIENVDQAGGCSYNYSCVYTDTISWASPTDPLPMIRDPRAVFDQLFGVGATPEARRARRKDDQSILDWVAESVGDLRRKLGPADRARLADYLDDVREIERRIQKVEQSNQTGEPRELPGAPIGVPDSFEEHVKLMFDLQAVAFAADTTRIFSFKFSRDVSNRVFAASGSTAAFHTGVASPRSRGSHHRLPEDQHLSRRPGAVPARQAEEDSRTATATCSTTR